MFNDAEDQAGTPKGGNGRKHFVAVQLDGEYRMQAVTPLLHAVIEAVADRPDIGIGLISMLGFEDTARLLRASPPLRCACICCKLTNTLVKFIRQVQKVLMAARGVFKQHRSSILRGRCMAEG